MYLDDVWYCFKQFNKFCESIICHSTLFAKVMVVSGNEFAEWHATPRTVTQQVHCLSGKLLRLLHLFLCLICEYAIKIKSSQTCDTINKKWNLRKLSQWRLLPRIFLIDANTCPRINQATWQHGSSNLEILNIKWI